LILSCSPRLGGNCDDAAEIVLKAAGKREFPSVPEITFLRDYTIFPCTGCHWCSASPEQCPLREKDDSLQLFTMLQNAPELVLIAPIYFYHLPVHLKALIDRSQTYWNLRQKVKNPARPLRKAHIILMGGRKKGEQLFSGSLLSCRYWLDLFGFALDEPLCIYGVDNRGDLLRNDITREGVSSYADKIYG
jgi:multimeric flavodoxin WrbA